MTRFVKQYINLFMQNNINDKEIANWVNECPTHKIEVLYSDENGIQLLVNFNNEKEENNE